MVPLAITSLATTIALVLLGSPGTIANLWLILAHPILVTTACVPAKPISIICAAASKAIQAIAVKALLTSVKTHLAKTAELARSQDQILTPAVVLAVSQIL